MAALPAPPARAASPAAGEEEGDPSDYPFRLSVRNTFLEVVEAPALQHPPAGAPDQRRACSAPPDSPSSKVAGRAASTEQPEPAKPGGAAASSSSGASAPARPAASLSSNASAPAEDPGGSEWLGLDLGVATDSEGDQWPAPPWTATVTSPLNAAAPSWEPQACDVPGAEHRLRGRRDWRGRAPRDGPWPPRGAPPPGEWAPAAGAAAWQAQGCGVPAPWTDESTAGVRGAAGGRSPPDALPSLGSANHHRGVCKPCAFFANKGCGNGFNCTFCHLCDAGEKKRRRKEKLELRRSYRADRAERGRRSSWT